MSDESKETGADGLWSTDRTAEYLDLAPRTLVDWRYQGRGPEFVRLGTAVRYRPEDVRQWVADQRAGSTTEADHGGEAA